MKTSRLLEIIREEISEALNVLVTNKKGETTTMPFNTPDEKTSVTNLKSDSNITNIETTAGQNIKEGEKRKKLAEKYQLDEEIINEMASIKQLKSELERQGKEAELKAQKEQTALNRKAYKDAWYQANKEKILEESKEKHKDNTIICEDCGGSYVPKRKEEHMICKKHLLCVDAEFKAKREEELKAQKERNKAYKAAWFQAKKNSNA